LEPSDPLVFCLFTGSFSFGLMTWCPIIACN